MSARRWAEQAHASQVVATGIVGVVLLVLGVVVAVPEQESGSDLLSGLMELPVEVRSDEATAVSLVRGGAASGSEPSDGAPQGGIHHLYPSVPWYRYRAAFRELRPLLESEGARIEGRDSNQRRAITFTIATPS